jgi:DNA-binding NarL/FixJ family response regulator
MIRIAVVEDDPIVVRNIEATLAATEDLRLLAPAYNFASGCELIDRGGFDVLLCDLGLPDGSGINLIKKASAKFPEIDILVISIFADQAKVLESIKAGARGYLLKDGRFENWPESIREVRNGGSPITPIIARQLLRQFVPPSSEDRPRDNLLTKREQDVLQMLSRGYSYAEVADLLGLSSHTVPSHVKNIYRKLEVNSKSEAIYEASSRGLINL